MTASVEPSLHRGGPDPEGEQPGHAQDHVGRMARNGGRSIIGAAVSAIAGVALTAIITNGLDQSAAGTVFATTALFLIATSLVQLGTEVGVVRYLPALLLRGQARHLRAVLRHALIPVVVASVVAAGLCFVFAPTIARSVADGANPDLVTQQIRVLALFLPLTSSYNVLQAATRGLRSMGATVVVESFGRTVGQVVAVGLVQLMGLGAVAVVAAYSIPYALGLVATLVWLVALLRRFERKTGPARDDRGAGAAGSRADAVRGFWGFTAPRAVGTTSQMLLKRSDIVLVAALRSPKEAALYAAASRFVVIGQLGVQALQQALSPQLAALFADDDQDSARVVYRATTAWSMLVAWPVYLVCAVLAPELLRVFGKGYDSVAPVAVLLSLAMLASTACGAVDTVLLMSGHTWLSLGNNVLALVLNVGLNLLLVPHYGALGAGVSWTVAILVRNLLPLIQVTMKYKISPISRETVLVGVFAATCFGLFPLAVRLLTDGSGPVVAALVVGSAAYAALMWRLRVELQMSAFRGILRRRAGRVVVSAG